MDLAERDLIVPRPDYGFLGIAIPLNIGVCDCFLLGTICYCHHVSDVCCGTVPFVSGHLLQ